MSTEDNSSNNIAVKYLGRAFITTIVGIILYAMANVGYNVYIHISQEKIEVQTTNSNSLNKTTND